MKFFNNLFDKFDLTDFYKNKSPVARKMLFVILASSTLITLIAISIQLAFEYQTEVDEIEHRIDQIESSYVNPIALSIWTFDKDQYEAQLNGILNIQDIVYVKIFTEDGKEFISKGTYQADTKLTREFHLETIIYGKKINIGKIVIEATLQRVYDDLLYRSLIILLTQGIKTLIISFIILYLFYYLVARHLYVIAKYTQELDLDGDDTLSLDKDYANDELDNISQVINHMKSRIQSKQQDLESLNKNLEHKVHERTKKLEELMYVQNKMASMGKMIENIAHQWRQPLASINTSVMLIDKKSSTNKDIYTKIEQELDSIESITDYLSKTIDDIRNFYSKEKTKRSFYLSDIVSSSINIVNSLFKKDNIDVIKECNTTIKISSYPNELQQVILSILQNAKDALVENSIKEPKVYIVVSQSIDNKEVFIKIIDNAGGIDKNIIDKIFDPYFTTKSAQEGTGIGLYITKMIIEQSLNGSILAYNIDDGACFEISLSTTS
jgi:signal transduction histidine kinase